MSQSKEVLDSVAQYLPEGLDEGTLEKVSELVAVIIEAKSRRKSRGSNHEGPVIYSWKH